MMASLLRLTRFASAILSRRLPTRQPPLVLRSSSASSVSYPLALSSVSRDHASVYAESLDNPEAFWGHLARTKLSWFKEFDKVVDCDMNEGRLNWFAGGKINATGIILLCSVQNLYATFKYFLFMQHFLWAIIILRCWR